MALPWLCLPVIYPVSGFYLDSLIAHKLRFAFIFVCILFEVSICVLWEYRVSAKYSIIHQPRWLLNLHLQPGQNTSTSTICTVSSSCFFSDFVGKKVCPSFLLQTPGKFNQTANRVNILSNPSHVNSTYSTYGLHMIRTEKKQPSHFFSLAYTSISIIIWSIVLWLCKHVYVCISWKLYKPQQTACNSFIDFYWIYRHVMITVCFLHAIFPTNTHTHTHWHSLFLSFHVFIMSMIC